MEEGQAELGAGFHEPEHDVAGEASGLGVSTAGDLALGDVGGVQGT